MLKIKTGSFILMVLLAVLVFQTAQRTANAEASWNYGFELDFNGALIGAPWGSVEAYADGVAMIPHGGLISAHLGDSTGGYAVNTTHRLSRPVNVEYAGTQIQFWASYVMADVNDFATFEYSIDGGYTWTRLWGPVSQQGTLQPFVLIGPLNLPVGTNAIRFFFSSDSTGVVNPGGLWIDDVQFMNPGFPLTVLSDWGDPQPTQGMSLIPEASNALTLSVTSPYNHPLLEGVRFVCTGYIGDGVVVKAEPPDAGPFDEVDVIVDAPGWIQWKWAREFGIQAISQDGVGSPGTEGWTWFPENGQASVTGTQYVESAVPGWGWRCNGFLGTGSAPTSGVFLPGEEISLQFVITEYSSVTWTWASQYKLYIVNPGGWGNPNPGVDTWYDVDKTVNATIEDSATDGETARHSLTGYTLEVGSNPPIHGTDRAVTFDLTSPATLTWHWTTEYVLDIRNPQFIGTITPDVGVYWITEGDPVVCSVVSPTSDGVNTWLAIGYEKNGVTTYFSNYTNPQVNFNMDSTIQFSWIWQLESLAFEVISPHGEPTPGIGVQYYQFDSVITASVGSPYYPVSEPGVMHVCTGFTATGSITPTSSSQLSVTFTLRDQNTTITWNWYTQYQLTVLSEKPDVTTIPEMRQGGYWFPENTTINASCEAKIPGFRCSGYLVTEGPAQSQGAETYVSFPIVAPTTITWQWTEEEILTRLPSWNEPLQITDVNAKVGLFTSMKRDPVTGFPSVAYYKVNGSEAGALYIHIWDGVQWHTEIVDETEGGNVGLYASLVLDSFGRPHIAYYDAGHGDLKYAYRSVSGGWITSVVDSGGPADNNVGMYCSLKLNSLNEPRVSYYDATLKDLKFAAQEYGVWNVYIVDASGEVGSHTCIALDPISNMPRIAYRDDGHMSLKFAWFDDDLWTTMTVDSSDDTGYTPSMVIDSTGSAHIAYQLFNGITSALIYAIQSGGSFYTKTVASETGSNTGFVPSMMLDSTGHPHIAYNDNADHSLVYAVYNGTTWLTQNLDSASVGSFTSLDLFGNVPAVAYWSFTGLRYIEAKTASTTGGSDIPVNNTDSGGLVSGGGCFVATSAFGSYANSSVVALCSLRDSNLLTSLNGDAIVSMYYAVSPAVAREFSGSVKAILRSMLGHVR